MAQSISNLYASQVFAEHPIVLWTLDEDFAFVNLLSASTQNISYWNTTGGTSSSASISSITNVDQRTLPVEDDLYSLSKSASVTSASVIYPSYFTESSLDTNKKSVAFNTWFLAPTTVDQVELWFDVSGSSSYSSSAVFDNSTPTKWSFASHTIDLAASASFKPYLKVKYLTESAGVNTFFNGISVGQWSELYARETSGINPTSITNQELASIIPTASANYSLSEIKPYGFNTTDTGYYLINRNKMLANNTSLPMVFGSGNLTRINSPVDAGVPSIALPGKTFLNEYGKYKQLTMEFWLRVFTDSITPKRIFGPISNSDGLYVEQEFLTLKVGPYTKSYFVGKWYRPMLVDIRYTRSNVSVLVNGDLVIDMDIEVDNITFSGPTEDWLGFFGHDDVYPFEIDSVAIYPYIVPEQIARRRFVYAQAVDNPEEIVSDFKGESFFIDFPYSKYTASMMYPDTNPWTSGFISNLKSNSRSLSFPDYTLPEFRITDSLLSSASVSINKFLSDNYDIQNEEYTFIKMRPTGSYSSSQTSIYFDSINPISAPVQSLFGTFKAPSSLPTYANKENILTFTSALNSNRFSINVSQAGLEYEFFNGASAYQIANYSASANQYLYAGFDLEEITKQNYAIIGNFFSNPKNISLNLGGYGSNIFTGNIYNLHFNNKMFTTKDISDYITSLGTIVIPQADVDDDTFNPFSYISNYTFLPIESYGEIVFDIGVSGYWEDSIPLSYFGKFVQDGNQNTYYDLDFIQFNIDVPGPITYSAPVQGEADAFGIKTYITLQDFEEVGKKTYSSYTQIENIGSSRVLELLPQFSTLLKKFEIVDGTIIYPPKELIDFENYYITVHMEMKVRGLLSKPVNIKRMSFNSLAFDETQEYRLGTRSGHSIVPFARTGLNYNYKAKNPFVIYRDSTPYLYLTADSGISVAPYNSASVQYRGLSFPMNDHESQTYKLTGLQFWMFYNKDKTISSTQKIATIIATENNNGLNDYFDLYLVPELNGKRGSLKLYKNDILYENAVFFINGKIIDEMKIVPLEWTSILISFTDVVDITLDDVVGKFEIYEGFVANNVAFFQQEFVNFFDKLVGGKQWTELPGTDWDYPTQNLDPNTGQPYTWRNWAEITITDITSQTGDSTFKTYLGLSEQVFDDTANVVTNSDGFDALTNVTWSSFVVKPV